MHFSIIKVLSKIYVSGLKIEWFWLIKNQPSLFYKGVSKVRFEKEKIICKENALFPVFETASFHIKIMLQFTCWVKTNKIIQRTFSNSSSNYVVMTGLSFVWSGLGWPEKSFHNLKILKIQFGIEWYSLKGRLSNFQGQLIMVPLETSKTVKISVAAKFEISNRTAMGRRVFCQKINEIAICPLMWVKKNVLYPSELKIKKFYCKNFLSSYQGVFSQNFRILCQL